MSVDFGEQKSGVKDKTVSQDNNNQPILNPVCLYASTISRLMSYPKFDTNWEIFTLHDSSKFSKISSREILHDLRCSVDCIGEEALGFTSDKVGTHSVRASLAMMMYLVKEPVYTIMLVGRWNSDAFLAYIEKQVKEFTRGVSTRMLQNAAFSTHP